MISVHFRYLGGAALLLAGLPAVAHAQASLYPPGAVVQPLDTGAEELSRHLNDLASNPRDVDALIGAADAALAVGDTDGALSFFARAEEIAPRDGRIKAGMGAAFVRTEQPEAALRFFGEAASMGIPAAQFAKDRGLAYDMTGDPARAQADYALALRSEKDEETERRLALSKAISGDTQGALALLEPQLQRQDRAAWRARAFVVAMSGRTDEATRLVETLMPGTSATMRPFLEMLPRLGPADRAMAVHFGRFPDRRQWAALGSARPTAAQPAPVRTAAAPARPPVQRQSASQPQATQPQRQPAPPPQAQASRPQVETAQAAPAVAPQGPPNGVVPPRPATSPPSMGAAEIRLPETAPRPSAQLRFADVAAAVQSLPGATASASQPKATPPKKAAPPVKKASPPAEPERIWVQLAAARDTKAFPFEFRRISAKAPDLLKGKTAWTAPLGATNRLLVGPFNTAKEARDLVTALAAKDVESLSWTSKQGEKVARVPAK